MAVATPSGITLAPEGGAHQSIATPLIGMAQDGLAAFEPAFVDELAVIMRWGFDYMQRDGKRAAEDKPTADEKWIRDSNGGSVYLRLSTRAIEQPQRAMDETLAHNIIEGGYWLRKPGPNPDCVVVAMGAIVPEAIRAVGMMAEDRRDVGLMVVTSADRLNAGWTAAQRARQSGLGNTQSHIETLLDQVPRSAALISVLDGHPATLAWMAGVHGHRVTSLGVEHFGQTGDLEDLYAHYRIDSAAIVDAAEHMAPGRPVRRFAAL